MKTSASFFAFACWAMAAGGTNAQSPAQSTTPTTATSRPAPPILWKFARGQTLRYQECQDRDIRRVEGELTYPLSDIQRTMDIRWYVEDVDSDGTASITQTIERVQESKDGPKGRQESDSKKNRKGASVLAGAKFTFRMSPHGRSSEVTLPSRLEKALDARLPGELTAIVGQWFEHSMPSFPLPSDDSCREQPWSNQTELPLATLGAFKLTRVYGYAGQKQQPDRLASDGFRITTGAEVIEDPRTTYRLELNPFSGKGTIEFDVAGGRLLASTEQFRFEATATFGVRSTHIRARSKTTWRLQSDPSQAR